MKLYEVNQAIESLMEKMVNQDTGELVMDCDDVIKEIDELQLERKNILEYLAKLVLNTRAEIDGIKNEMTRLKSRSDTLTKQSNRLMEVLDRECDGQKTDLSVATLSYRKTTHVEVPQEKESYDKTVKWLKDTGHWNCLRIADPEIAKSEIKKLLTTGVDVPGCAVVEDRSCTLK